MELSANMDKSADISRLTPNLVYEALDSNQLGLAQEEAQSRQAKQGKNLIEEKAKRYVILIFLSNRKMPGCLTAQWAWMWVSIRQI